MIQMHSLIMWYDSNVSKQLFDNKNVISLKETHKTTRTWVEHVKMTKMNTWLEIWDKFSEPKELKQDRNVGSRINVNKIEYLIRDFG